MFLMYGTMRLALNEGSVVVDLPTGIGRLGYVSTERPTTSPEVRRRKRELKRLPLFLPPELWERLTLAAEFATRSFELTGKPETVSRNDFIEDNLLWALASYWEDKGGEPSSKDDPRFERLAKTFAERLKARDKKKAQ